MIKNIEKMLECKENSKQQEDLELIAKSNIDFEKYNRKTVFITGATGLVGSGLVKTFLCVNRLRGLEINIIAAVRNEKKAEMLYGDLLKRKELELYIGDIVEPIETEKNINYIFHTASITASKQMVEHPVMTIETSYQGTHNILELAREKAVEGVVYVSSMEVYGRPEKATYIKEKDLGYVDLTNVRSCYPEGKRICECLCNAYASEYKIPVKIARLAQTFGAGILESDNRVYVQFAKSAIEKKDIVLHTEGTSEGNYCYTRDTIKALLLLGYTGESGEAYNIVNENTHMQIRKMAAMVAEKIANKEINVVFDIPESALKYGYAPSVKMKLNGEKMRALGWKPEVDLPEMYERMIADIAMGEA